MSELLSDKIQDAKIQYLNSVEPYRAELYKYCRHLSRHCWDAEDLVQETLLKAFARLGEIQGPFENPKSYLFKMATNAWIDRKRKGSVPFDMLEAAEEIGQPETMTAKLEFNDALKIFIQSLPPSERLAVILIDLFSFTSDEAAQFVGSTAGAVKMAASRGRRRLSEQKLDAKVPTKSATGSILISTYADAFNRRDIEKVVSLLSESAIYEVQGVVHEQGIDAIRNGSLALSFKVSFESEVVEYNGEQIVLRWFLDPSGRHVVRGILRVQCRQEKISHVEDYFYCPEVINEVATELGLAFDTNGHHWAVPKLK